MSQAGTFTGGGGGGGGSNIQTITGNDGVAITPTANNVFIVGQTVPSGTNPIPVYIASTATNKDNVEVQVAAMSASSNVNNAGLASFSSSSFTVDANGFVTLNAGVSPNVEFLTGNSGGQLSPTANNFNTLGTGSITIAGAGSTLTTQLTGLTNHAVLVGAGTATITKVGPSASTGQILQNNAGADPSYSTATYPSTTTINQILFSSAANTVTGLATANNGVLTTGTSGIPVITSLASNGQLIIGSGSGAPAAATLTAGTGISITNAANSITIATVGNGFAWVDVTTATQSLAVQTGYVTDHTNVTYTLPATANLGDTIKIVGKLGITTIAQNANQQILMSSASSTVGVTGSINGTNVGDCVELVCVTAGASTVWRGANFVGNWTVT